MQGVSECFFLRRSDCESVACLATGSCGGPAGPVVEPRRGGAGHRPRPPHRPDQGRECAALRPRMGILQPSRSALEYWTCLACFLYVLLGKQYDPHLYAACESPRAKHDTARGLDCPGGGRGHRRGEDPRAPCGQAAHGPRRTPFETGWMPCTALAMRTVQSFLRAKRACVVPRRPAKGWY